MEVEILHPDGDVILVVGKDEEIQKYRVSSAFLSHASPVFTAMFAKDRFAEGQNLSSANPKEVRLPDDDPDSIDIICRVAHLDHDGLPEALSLERLRLLAMVADKYGCVSSLSLAAKLWFQEIGKSTSSVRDILTLAEISYRLNLSKLFRHYTGLLAYQYGYSFVNLAESSALPPIVFLYLGRQRRNAEVTLRAEMLRREESISHSSSEFFKKREAIYLTDVKTILEAGGIHEDGIVETDLKTKCRVIRHLAEKMKQVWTSAYGSSQNDRDHEHAIIDRVKNIAEITETACRGLCLTCVLEGDHNPDLCRENY